MRAVDTNVLLRLITQDDPEQYKRAREFVSIGAWVPTLAVVEAMWVLSRGYRFTAPQIVNALEMILSTQVLVVEDSELVRSALDILREYPALGFSDCVMLTVSRHHGHLPLGTFDRRLGKLDGAKAL